jgi:hypothetical protein
MASTEFSTSNEGLLDHPDSPMWFPLDERRVTNAQYLYRAGKKIWKGKQGLYWPPFVFYDDLPQLSGMPQIIREQYSLSLVRNKIMKQYMYRINKAPNDCTFRSIINHPIKRMGAYQLAATGLKGTGKTNIIALVSAMNAAYGHSIFTFNDSFLEGRHFVPHGWFDQHNRFRPFEVDFLFPEGYQFQRADNPLWDLYPDNCQQKEWTDVEGLVNEFKPRRISIIYDDCYDTESRLQLLIDIMLRLQEIRHPNKFYTFLHNELSTLIPEVPQKGVAKLVTRVGDIVTRSRKDNICFVTAMHMGAEVHYRTNQKFDFLLIKRPVNRKNMTQAEEAAKSFGPGQVNVCKSGYYMRHSIGMYPELSNNFDLKLKSKHSYPQQLESIDKDLTQEGTHRIWPDLTDRQVEICTMYYIQTISMTQIAKTLRISRITVKDTIDAVGKKFFEGWIGGVG